ncbi:class C sortase [Corynebacterium pelargi]|uniref:Sortase family protein n=1 Tax=Corynebacterium pelargi TaxID=1471400 RepID=A0A410WBM9_9CORY|nr:class C sortase [Corynebacterium pelargi]QAU53352.1 Sortase family protein [Corynebacterium pelargi]GGG73070.1 class C sortase [Corynebacterium pelargi]
MTTASLERHEGGKHTNERSMLQRIMPLIIVLIGFAIVMYPVMGTWVRNVTQTKQAEAYTSRINDETTEEERAASLASAEEWNRNHAQGPVLDPWLARVDESNLEYQEYLKELDLDDVMGRIIIPKIDSDLPIYHGTDEKTLGKGIGHLYGSSLPVGGEGSHSVLTGHTGLPNATLWDRLVDLDKGDSFTVYVAGRVMKYEIGERRVVLPTETNNLRPVEGEDLVTLITCTPYGVNSHRLVLTAHRVPIDDEEAREILNQKHNPWQWWMILALVLSLAVLIAGIAWTVRGIKRSKAQEEVE